MLHLSSQGNSSNSQCATWFGPSIRPFFPPPREFATLLLVRIVRTTYCVCIYTYISVPCRTLVAIYLPFCAQVYLHFGSQQTSFDFVAETFAVWLMVSSGINISRRRSVQVLGRASSINSRCV